MESAPTHSYNQSPGHLATNSPINGIKEPRRDGAELSASAFVSLCRIRNPLYFRNRLMDKMTSDPVNYSRNGLLAVLLIYFLCAP